MFISGKNRSKKLHFIKKMHLIKKMHFFLFQGRVDLKKCKNASWLISAKGHTEITVL